jgi:anti-sigma B factor antagonist
MVIETIQEPNATVVRVSGRMDAENASSFEDACSAAIRGGNAKLIADVTELEYVSSMGLRSFLTVAKTAQSKGGSLSLCGLRGLPRQVFEMTRLMPLFPVFDSREAALQSMA